MQTFLLIMMGLSIGAMCISMWSLICNNKALKERLIIIDNCTDFNNFKRISYMKHLWYVMTFRNAKKLYKTIKE